MLTWRAQGQTQGWTLRISHGCRGAKPTVSGSLLGVGDRMLDNSLVLVIGGGQIQSDTIQGEEYTIHHTHRHDPLPFSPFTFIEICLARVFVRYLPGWRRRRVSVSDFCQLLANLPAGHAPPGRVD